VERQLAEHATGDQRLAGSLEAILICGATLNRAHGLSGSLLDLLIQQYDKKIHTTLMLGANLLHIKSSL